MLDEIKSKTVYYNKTKKVIDTQTGKRSKTLSQVKPVENISKNLSQTARDKLHAKGNPLFT